MKKSIIRFLIISITCFFNYTMFAQEGGLQFNFGVSKSYGGNKDFVTYFENYEKAFGNLIEKKGSKLKSSNGFEVGANLYVSAINVSLLYARDYAASEYLAKNGDIRKTELINNVVGSEFMLMSHESENKKRINVGFGLGINFIWQKVKSKKIIKPGNTLPVADFLTGEYKGEGINFSIFPQIEYNLHDNVAIFIKPQVLINMGGFTDLKSKTVDYFPQDPGTWTRNTYLYEGDYIRAQMGGFRLSCGISFIL